MTSTKLMHNIYKDFFAWTLGYFTTKCGFSEIVPSYFKIITKVLIISIMSPMCLLGCSLPNAIHGNNFKIVYFDKGVSKDVIIDKSNNIVDYVKKLVEGTDDNIRLIVTQSTIDDAKQKRCIEITFTDEISVTTNNGKHLSFSKILIILKNNIESNNSSSVVFYCGKKEYFTPPFINSKGYPIAEIIRGLCEDTIENK